MVVLAALVLGGRGRRVLQVGGGQFEDRQRLVDGPLEAVPLPRERLAGRAVPVGRGGRADVPVQIADEAVEVLAHLPPAGRRFVQGLRVASLAHWTLRIISVSSSSAVCAFATVSLIPPPTSARRC